MKTATTFALVVASAVAVGLFMQPDPKPPAAAPMPVASEPQTVRLAPARPEDDDDAWYVGTASRGCVSMADTYGSENASQFLQVLEDDGITPMVEWSNDQRIAVLYDPSGSTPVMILARGSGHCGGSNSILY